METTLRPAKQADAWPIRQLIWKVGINPTGLNWRRFTLVVDPNGRLLGCGQIKPHNDGSLELASIAVQPEARGLGIARKVIEHLLAGSSRPLFLRCRSPLQSFYEKFGFRVIGPEALPPSLRGFGKMIQTMHKLRPNDPPPGLVMRLD